VAATGAASALRTSFEPDAVRSERDKKARLNCIAHRLEQILYNEIPYNPVVLPARVHNPNYHRGPVPPEMYVPERYEATAGGCRRRFMRLL
jgi:hypothetical protein